MLIGRENELRRLRDALQGARSGHSAALVLTGPAGVGKTALVREMIRDADGMTVLWTQGVQSELEMPFAGLLDLLRPISGKLPPLPASHEQALRQALALGPPDVGRFPVAAAVLGVLVGLAERRPLLVAVDDAHWIDRASSDALLFAARRLRADRAVVVWVVRDGEPASRTDGIPELTVGPLAEAEARLLLAEHAPDLAADVASELVRAAGGYPLAVVQMPKLLNRAQRSGLEPLPRPLPAGNAGLRLFRPRLQALPAAARDCLLLAAVSEYDELALLWRGLASLGASEADLAVAERAGLISIARGRVSFLHPLVRSVVYEMATAEERRRAHRACAEAVDPERLADAYAWHMGLATLGPDEEVARRLEAAGRRAMGLSWGAAARAMEEAAAHSADAAPRGRRLLEAGQAYLLAGQLDRAEPMLSDALEAPLELNDGVRAERALARLLATRGDIVLASERWIHASDRAASSSADLAASALVEAMDALAQANLWDAFEAIAQKLRSLPRSESGLQALATLLRLGDAAAVRGHGAEAVKLWNEAVAVGKRPETFARYEARTLVQEALFSAGRDEEARALAEGLIADARKETRLADISPHLSNLAILEARRGRLRHAAALADEARELATAIGSRFDTAWALGVLAWVEAQLGAELDCRTHADELLHGFSDLPPGFRRHAHHAIGLLELGLGHADKALPELEEAAALQATGHGEPFAGRPLLSSLVEALMRAGRTDEARDQLDQFRANADGSNVDSALADTWRLEGLLGPDDTIDDRFARARAHHQAGGNLFEAARTDLSWGERLRRARRPLDARVALRAAKAPFEAMGAASWAERARLELRAAGDRRRRRDAASDELTSQELNVAMMVAEGLTNREVAARAYLSPKTVEAHLARVFSKLGVRSRTELALRFRSGDVGIPPMRRGERQP